MAESFKSFQILIIIFQDLNITISKINSVKNFEVLSKQTGFEHLKRIIATKGNKLLFDSMNLLRYFRSRQNKA